MFHVEHSRRLWNNGHLAAWNLLKSLISQPGSREPVLKMFHVEQLRTVELFGPKPWNNLAIQAWNKSQDDRGTHTIGAYAIENK